MSRGPERTRADGRGGSVPLSPSPCPPNVGMPHHVAAPGGGIVAAVPQLRADGLGGCRAHTRRAHTAHEKSRRQGAYESAFLHPVELNDWGFLRLGVGLHMLILGGQGHVALSPLHAQRGFVHPGRRNAPDSSTGCKDDAGGPACHVCPGNKWFGSRSAQGTEPAMGKEACQCQCESQHS